MERVGWLKEPQRLTPFQTLRTSLIVTSHCLLHQQNGTEREYNQFDLPFTVTSYSHLKGYTGTDRDKAEAWQIAKYETREGTYSASESEKGWHDAGTTLPALATAILKTSGNGGTSAEANKLTFKDDYKADFR